MKPFRFTSIIGESGIKGTVANRNICVRLYLDVLRISDLGKMDLPILTIFAKLYFSRASVYRRVNKISYRFTNFSSVVMNCQFITRRENTCRTLMKDIGYLPSMLRIRHCLSTWMRHKKVKR